MRPAAGVSPPAVVDFWQHAKAGQVVSGDVFLSRRLAEEGRLIAVLSDGLGSGIKASVLATMTATMALKYTAAFADVQRSAQTIMETLPVCSVRKISYATFTIVDVVERRVRLIEHGNPHTLVFRGRRPLELTRVALTPPQPVDRHIEFAELEWREGDRIVCFTDGVCQAGMGEPRTPLGWGNAAVAEHVAELLGREPGLPGRVLARRLAEAARLKDGGAAKDDTTCAVIAWHEPRRLLVVSGPPFAPERDRELADRLVTFPGRKVIAGGTTAAVVARELGLEVRMDLDDLEPDLPPTSRMEGIDLVTEGALTLERAARILERETPGDLRAGNAAARLVNLLLESDTIEFLVGTRVNEAHQDPRIPVEMDLRRNIIRRMTRVLEQRHFKVTETRLI